MGDSGHDSRDYLVAQRDVLGSGIAMRSEARYETSHSERKN